MHSAEEDHLVPKEAPWVNSQWIRMKNKQTNKNRTENKQTNKQAKQKQNRKNAYCFGMTPSGK